MVIKLAPLDIDHKPVPIVNRTKMIIDIKNESGWRKRVPINEMGQYHGKCLDWYKDGNRWEEVDYVNGECHGKFLSWYINGNKGEECDYVNGKYHGKYFLWYNNGNKCKVDDYVNGKYHGKEISWDCDGRIVWERNNINENK